MLSLIKFFPADKSNEITAGIFLDDEYERFSLNLTDWTKEDYICQWKHAARYALENRDVSAFIKNYESAQQSVKMIWINTIIPEELTDPRKYLTSEDGQNFFITESVVFITENENTFTSDDAFNEIKQAFGNCRPIFYFDKNRIDKFYLYLSDRIEGVSNWTITKQDLESIFNL